MSIIDDYKAMGIKQFTVKNGEAIAVNPWTPVFNKEWKPVNDLPPIPAPNIEPGLYEIEQFGEEHQYRQNKDCHWVIDTEPEDESDYGVETRTVLVLKEQVERTAEEFFSDYDLGIPISDLPDFYKAVDAYAKERNTIVKKTAEEYEVTFGSHLKCKISIGIDGVVVIEAAMDGYGNAIPLDQITVINL